MNEIGSNLYKQGRFKAGSFMFIKGSLQKKKNSQIWDIVQKIETPPPAPPNLDVLSLDILRYLRPPLPHPLVWTISRKKFVPKTKDYNLQRSRYQRKKMIL